MHAVQGLGKIYNVHIESSLPFGTLFNYISRRENLMDKTASCPETCLFPVKFKVMMTSAKILLGVDNRIKTEKKEREKNQPTSTKTVSKKRQNKCTNEIISQKQKIINLKKKRQKMIIIKGKIKKTTKAKCKFRGEELLGPQARFRVTPIV